MSVNTKKPFFFPGTSIGPYTLVRELGKGTFGVVWLAERRGRLATTRVALKSPVGLNDNDRQHLVRESELWIRSSGHPNVMPVIEADEYDGVVAIVTEYAPEGSLESWLGMYANQAPMVETGIAFAAGVLTGLGYLHQRGVIHRDLKPGNILLQGGIPRITDFGLARMTSTAKHSNSIAGTPGYMAPEAWRGTRSEQTDIWSVGVMLYEMLAGHFPFPTDNWDELRNAVELGEPDPLPESLPIHVRNTILTALQKNPRDRFRTAEEMATQLRQPSAPVPRAMTEASAFGLGNLHEKLHHLDSILRAIENSTPQSNSPFYIGRTLVEAASIVEDHDDRLAAETLLDELIGEVESIQRREAPAHERVVSISKARDLLHCFKEIKKAYLEQTQQMTRTSNFA